MRLPIAYRSLARPSSAPEPSNPPAGIVANVVVTRYLNESSGRLDRTYTWCHIRPQGGDGGRVDPSQARFDPAWCICRRTTIERRPTLKGTDSVTVRSMDPSGVAPDIPVRGYPPRIGLVSPAGPCSSRRLPTHGDLWSPVSVGGLGQGPNPGQ